MSSSFQCNHTPSTNRITNATSISVRPNDKTAIPLFHSVSLILPISTCAILYDLAPHVHPCTIIFSATSFITIYSILFVSDITILPPIYSFILNLMDITRHLPPNYPFAAADAAADINFVHYPSCYRIKSYLILWNLDSFVIWCTNYTNQSIQYILAAEAIAYKSSNPLTHPCTANYHSIIIAPDQYNQPYLSPYVSFLRVHPYLGMHNRTLHQFPPFIPGTHDRSMRGSQTQPAVQNRSLHRCHSYRDSHFSCALLSHIPSALLLAMQNSTLHMLPHFLPSHNSTLRVQHPVLYQYHVLVMYLLLFVWMYGIWIKHRMSTHRTNGSTQFARSIEERQWQKHALSIIQGIRILFTATSKTTTS